MELLSLESLFTNKKIHVIIELNTLKQEVRAMTIGQNIKKFRKEKGFTQKELAEIVGVSVQAISKWETDTGYPDISQVVPLASALNISTDELFDYSIKDDLEELEYLKKDFEPQSVFRDSQGFDKNYELLYSYFLAHPKNAEAASMCLKSLVDLIVANDVPHKSKGELISEIERYANCIFKYESRADDIFMSKLILSRGYSALGESEKAKELIKSIPVTFGDRLYWEAEIAQANKEYEDAMLKCRESFAMKARYISRCIRMAGEIFEEKDTESGLSQRMEYEEYMLRILNAFLSGGEYLPCRQIYQKCILLCGMVYKYINLGRISLAIERADMLFKGREEFICFLKNQKGKTSLLFENNDSVEYQVNTKHRLDEYAELAIKNLKNIPEYEKNSEIIGFLKKYGKI